jgi:hypothetical protein
MQFGRRRFVATRGGPARRLGGDNRSRDLDPRKPSPGTCDLDVAEVSAAVLPAGYPYIEVVACPSDLAAVRQELAPRYAPVAQGDAYTILART